MKKTLLQASCYTLGLSLLSTPAIGQITPDGSVPTKVEQQGKVTEITGGGQAGNNLFHSFKEFSVSTGREAFFNNATDISNILSRVTGGNLSNIDGLIRANGNANLFLINPAGIIFGDNARLDLGGSFFGSAGEGILFDDGIEFNANSSETPLLTVNAPMEFNLRDNTSNITNTANLKVDRDLTLTAGNLDLQGQLQAGGNLTLKALDTITIRDSLANPFVATAGNNLSLAGTEKISISALNNSNSGLSAGGDLLLQSDNPINGDAYYYSGGNFRLEQLDGSAGDFISVEDPVVRSQGDVSFQSYEGASLHILAGGKVEIAGDINITGTDTTANSLQERIALSDNQTTIDIDGSAEPTLDIRAGANDVGTPGITGNNTGFTPNTTNTATNSDITIGGSITNVGGRVLLTNQYQANNNLPNGSISATAINTSNSLGNGGDVAIDSRSNINVPEGINTSSVVNGELTTRANVQNSPQITINSGNGGAVTLLAADSITAGDFNTASGVNLNLITEVDTIEEANNVFAVPQAVVQAGAGGAIKLQANNNINTGNVNTAAEISLAADSVAQDNFSVILGLLALEADNGGEVNFNAANNLTTGKIDSRVAISDRLNSNTDTSPNITLAVSNVNLRIPQTNVGSGGDIFLTAGESLNTGSLDASLSLTNSLDNSATILADGTTVRTLARPSQAISTVVLNYENAAVGSGGGISITSDRANVGDINSSISLASDNTAVAEATADNDAAAEAVVDNDVFYDVVANSPGAIALQIDDSLNIGNLNNSATARGTNNIDENSITNSDNAFANTIVDSNNRLFFDSDSDISRLQINLTPPDVDEVDSIVSISNQAIDYEELVGDYLKTNNPVLNNRQSTPINTSVGKIYPARGVVIEGDRIILTPF